jgi:hypothetical protein
VVATNRGIEAIVITEDIVISGSFQRKCSGYVVHVYIPKCSATTGFLKSSAVIEVIFDLNTFTTSLL